MDIQKSFGLAVKHFRTEMNISQEKFALQIEMDRTYLASVESGRRNISINNIEKISNGLNIPISKLFEYITTIEKQKGDNQHE